MFSRCPENIIMWASPRDIFHTSLDVFQKFYANIEAAFYVSLYMFTDISICLPIVNIEKIFPWICCLYYKHSCMYQD